MDLHGIRQNLFYRLNRVNTPDEMVRFQAVVAEAMLLAEISSKMDECAPDSAKSHIKSLRLYTDALAWWNLHPHTIRQLAKNSSPRPSLLDQGPSFVNVLLHASKYAKDTKLPVLIADLTNVIKIGDLVVVTNPEKPTIVECKTSVPSPKHLMQGRSGRQICRAMGTMQYLATGSGKVLGWDNYDITVETKHKAERNWDIVEQLSIIALRQGEAYLEIGPGDYLWAARPEHQERVIQVIADKSKGQGHFQLGTTLGLMNFEDGLYPPPSAWRPVLQEVRFELMEATIVLYHLVNYEALEGDYGNGQRITIGNSDYPIVVNIDGQDFPVSRRFIYDVIYGFETMQSCAKGLLLFGHDLKAVLGRDLHLPTGSGTKPSLWYAETEEQMLALLRQDNVKGTDYVCIPYPVLRAFRTRLVKKESRIKSKGLALMTITDLRKLACSV